jgi:hypothetical protein
MHKLGKMVVSDKFLKEIIEETREILTDTPEQIKDFNKQFLINRSE